VSASVRNDGNLGTSYEAVLYVNGKAVERLYTNLARNTTKVEQFSPAELVAGENAIRVILDPDREKAESNESNNSRSTKVTCAKAPDPKPALKTVDLQVEKFEVLDAENKPGCVDGNANLIHVWITNAGDVEFLDGNFSIGLSIDGQPTKPLTMGGIGAPPSNKKDGFFENVSLTKGDHTFQVTVNPDGQAPEADTTNNTSAPQTVTCREQ
jgi:subtilase family serine protease